ncbi:MAG: hypothetical protein GX807_02670, partial [Erysipelotrichia bacterium]|nr:hypothetical protein [Erysipelotrichia bacterium]
MLKLLKFSKKMWWAIAVILLLLVGQAYMQIQLPYETGKILTILQDQTIGNAQRISDIWRTGLIML